MGESYRAEVVGSLLRPQYLQQARTAWREGRLSAAQLKRLEDRAVDQSVALQTGTGIDVMTDGEMRRTFFCDHVFTELHGLANIPSPPITLYHVDTGQTAEMSMPSSVVGKISRKRMLSAEEFTYLRSATQAPSKVTLSSPLLLHFLWHPDHSPQVYDDPYELFREGAALLREEALELARLGCTYIQIDAPELVQVLADPARWDRWTELGLQPERVVPEGIEIVNSVAAPIPGVTFALHVCRANAPSMALARGGYSAFVEKLLPYATNFDTLLLEYDDERSGDFAPLAGVPDDKRVVLGLVSTKHAAVEDAAGIRERINEAARYIDLDRLALSTQCGFASMEVGNELSFEQQEGKLRLVADVARQVWN